MRWKKGGAEQGRPKDFCTAALGEIYLPKGADAGSVNPRDVGS